MYITIHQVTLLVRTCCFIHRQLQGENITVQISVNTINNITKNLVSKTLTNVGLPRLQGCLQSFQMMVDLFHTSPRLVSWHLSLPLETNRREN